MSFITDAIGGLFGTKQQADASNLASRQQADAQYNAQSQLQANLAPYANFGASAMPNIMQKLGLGGQGGGFNYGPFSFNPQDLQNTPGYQFTLNQGLKNTNNALSNQGLLGSGAQAKALADYTSGLASNTYNDQFKNALNSYNANYTTGLGSFNANLSPLLQLLTMGQNSAAGIGQGAYNSSVNAGNAIAQGTVGSGAQGANTMNSLLGMANLANTAGATYTPSAGYSSGLSNIFSDIRAKENIEFRGYTPKGHKVYEFEYKPEFKDRAGHGRFVGVMAQEVEKTLPEAITVTPDGYKTVNYGLIG
jgi:hypothetical protein